jgi:hypothetical protein
MKTVIRFSRGGAYRFRKDIEFQKEPDIAIDLILFSVKSVI